jgi:hypothetical protein
MSKITFSVFAKNGGLLTKIIRPKVDGNGIEKDPSQCRMSAGMVETVTMPFKEFGAYIRHLNASQAIAHGVSGHSVANVVSEKNFSEQPATVTRTKKYFHYSNGPGLGLFDHDQKPGQVHLTPEEFREIVEGVCPAFRGVATVYTPSTSSCIFDATGNEITGVSTGFHLYFVAANAQVLPIFAETLFKRLCLTGHGYPFITRSGSILLRTIFDVSVFSPERLDFVSGAVCEGGCSQRLPDPVYTDGGMLKWTP